MELLKRMLPFPYCGTETKPVNIYRVWVLWWQGEKRMPEIVKSTYNSIKKSTDKEVVLITEENIKDYVHIPDYINDKVLNKKIGLPHLSDYIRFYLLNNYGGLWIDSTVLCGSKIPDYIYEEEFYTIKNLFTTNKYNPCGRWNIQVLGTSLINLPLFSYMQTLIENYWKKYDIAFDYLITDYMMEYCYEHNTQCKKLIDSVGINNQDMFALFINFNNEYNKEKWESWIHNGTVFFKLTYKFRQYKAASRNVSYSFYQYIKDTWK